MASPQISQQRVKEWLKTHDLNFDVDDDGDLRVGFDEVIFFIHTKEELLRVQGYWPGQFDPATDRERVLEVVNKLNTQTLMPKAMINGSSGRIIFEFAIADRSFSDERLANILGNTFSATFKAVQTVEEQLPDLAPQKG